MSRMPKAVRPQRSKGRPGVPKRLLFPLPVEQIRKLSLAAHVAFDAFQRGEGNRSLLYRLIRATYMSYLLWSDGIGNAEYQLYHDAERDLERAAELAEKTGNWLFEDDGSSAIEKVLRIYDEQIGGVSVKSFADCTERLDRLLTVHIPRKQKALFESARMDS